VSSRFSPRRLTELIGSLTVIELPQPGSPRAIPVVDTFAAEGEALYASGARRP
jgi:hypothetical protein